MLKITKNNKDKKGVNSFPVFANKFNELVDEHNNVEDRVTVLEGNSSPMIVMKITKTFIDWQPNATNTGIIIIGQLPAGSVVFTCKVKPSIAFQNVGSTLSYGTDIRIYGTGFTFNNFSSVTDSDIFSVSDILGTTFVSGPGSGSGVGEKIPNHVTTTDINAKLDVNADTINDLTQGSVDIWIWYAIGI